jgi:hypothetical protein
MELSGRIAILFALFVCCSHGAVARHRPAGIRFDCLQGLLQIAGADAASQPGGHPISAAAAAPPRTEPHAAGVQFDSVVPCRSGANE